MITFKELMGDHVMTEIPLTHQHNIEELLKRVNVIRKAWGKPMIVTSGYRSMQDHLRIYAAKGVPRDQIPMGSCHLTGEAVDIADANLELTNWLQNDSTGSKLLAEVDLYCELGNKNWVHFQTRKTKYGHWFKP